MVDRFLQLGEVQTPEWGAAGNDGGEVWGGKGHIPSPPGVGSGEGAVTPPQKISGLLPLKWFSTLSCLPAVRNHSTRTFPHWRLLMHQQLNKYSDNHRQNFVQNTIIHWNDIQQTAVAMNAWQLKTINT